MSPQQDIRTQLRRAAVRLANDDHDLRHALLDVYDDLQQAFADERAYPEAMRDEIRELRAEVEAIEPRFRSHRGTSVLFDREGLGSVGRTRAANLARRIIAVAQSLERQSGDS